MGLTVRLQFLHIQMWRDIINGSVLCDEAHELNCLCFQVMDEGPNFIISEFEVL